MERTVVVKTEAGKQDSLKHSVKIAFTITPDESNGPSHPYYPVSPSIKHFSANSEDSAIVTQTTRSAIRTYETRNWGYWTTGYHGGVGEGQGVTLTSSGWDYTDQQTSGLIVNKSGTAQGIIMSMSNNYHIAYHPLNDNASIPLVTSWNLQAYEVGDEVTDRTLLLPEHLFRPIFPNPILWNTLPGLSTWMLSEDVSGKLRIHNDRFSPPEIVTEPVGKKDALSEILERLAVMEKSINRIQDDVNTGRKTMDNIQNQLSTLERTTKEEAQESRRNIAAVEAKTAVLADSLGQSGGRLSEVREAVTDTQPLLAASQKQGHISLVQQTVPGGWPGGNAPGTGMPEQISSSKGQETGQDTQSPSVEVRVDKLERSMQEQRRSLRGMDRWMPAVEKLETDLAVVQVSVTGLGRRLGAMEARSRDDEEGAEVLPSSRPTTPVMFPNHLADSPPAP